MRPKDRVEVDDLALAEEFLQNFLGRYVNIDQIFVYEYKKATYILTIEKVMGGDKGHSYLGKDTKITCVGSG